MFYSGSFSEFYRLGDIVSGYTEIIPKYSSNKSNSGLSLSISIAPNDLFIILTPCCSIEKRVVNIAPLKCLDSNFLSSDRLIEDFLLINQPISKRVALGELIFSKLSDEDKLAYENAPITYEYIDKFIYDDHFLLKKYELTKKRGKDDTITTHTGKYMVSFKDTMKIESELFDRDKCNCVKVAELAAISRDRLREKISFFYSRIPEEDRPFLG